MKKMKSPYHGHRFPAVVISCAVRWYFRFNLSLRDIEEVLLECGVTVTYETPHVKRIGSSVNTAASIMRSRFTGTYFSQARGRYMESPG